jgi:hemophore-related protein
MTKLSLTRRLGVAVGGLTLWLTAGAGVASAAPDLGPAVNTTCTYEQFVAALNAANPTMAEYFNSSPQMQSGLRQFLAGSPSQRKQWAQEMVSLPQNQPYLGVIAQAFNTCNNF